MRQLPRGWLWTTLGEACEITQGQSPPGSSYNAVGQGLPFYQGKTDFGELHPTARSWCSAPQKLAVAEDILISVRAPVGPTNIAAERCCIGRGLAALRARDDICQYYVLHWLRLSEPELGHKARGSTFASITGTQLAAHPLPLAPLTEQRRIVAEIEKHLSALDAGCALLAGSQRKVTRCIDGILSTALLSSRELTLTDDRALGRRIRTERERLSGSRTALPPDNLLGLVAPAGWEIMSLDELTTRITSGARDWSPYYGSGAGTFIMAQNVRRGRLDLSFRQPIDPPLEDSSVQRSLVRYGDLLVTIVGANTGDACAVLEDLDQYYVCQSVALARPVLPQTSKYLMFWLLASRAGAGYFKKCVYGQGRPHLGFDQIKRTPVLVPPLDVMNAIVARIEDHLSLAEAVAVSVEHSQRHATTLRQAILRKAFEGKLVPQDPNDEPASVLLQRIRAARGHSLARAHAVR